MLLKKLITASLRCLDAFLVFRTFRLSDFRTLLLLALLPFLPGCTKYEFAENIPDAAYIRVFNSISTTVEPINGGGGINPFLTFLVDPEQDKNGAIAGAPVICDFLNTRQLYSASFPMEAGTDSGASTTIISRPGTGEVVYAGSRNYEYPGKAHVPTAPAMNGFDMSSWAQIRPGKHRVVFVVRPKNNTPFAQLEEGIRKTALIDTTIELKAGEVYTLQAVQTSTDNPVEFALYVRTEDFYRQTFEDNKIYVGFDNISGKIPLAAQLGYTPMLGDTLNIFYSYLMKDFTNDHTSIPLMGLNNLFYTTLSKKRAGKITSYMPIPMLPRPYFFNKDSTLKTFPSELYNNRMNFGYMQKDEYLPFVRFEFYNHSGNPASSLLTLNCSANPVTLPFYDQNVSLVRRYQANFNLIVNRNNKVFIYPTVNILEVSYDRVYMIQMQRAFNQVPQ